METTTLVLVGRVVVIVLSSLVFLQYLRGRQNLKTPAEKSKTFLIATLLQKKMPTLTKLYSMEETATHNKQDDCWIVIDGKVYDVSSYMDDHPGGDDVLLAVTGKDATDEFEDAGHSKDARELMEKYFIGELDESSVPEMPELKIYKKEQPTDSVQKLVDFTMQYWLVPVSIITISVAVRVLLSRKR